MKITAFLHRRCFSATVPCQKNVKNQARIFAKRCLRKTKPNNKFLRARCFIRINVSDHFVAESVFVARGTFEFHGINTGAIGIGRQSREQCWWWQSRLAAVWDQDFDDHELREQLGSRHLGNVGEVGDGEADGVSKFGSEEQAKRVQEEFARIARFFVEKVSQYLDVVGEEHGWIIALINAKTVGESLTPFWPQTPPYPCTGLRDLAEGFA